MNVFHVEGPNSVKILGAIIDNLEKTIFSELKELGIPYKFPLIVLKELKNIKILYGIWLIA